VMARAEVMEVKSDLLALQRRRTVDASVLSELLQLSDDTIKTINRLRSSL
jgi:hypothetical protein